MFRSEFNFCTLYTNAKWSGTDFALICSSPFYLSNNWEFIEFIASCLIFLLLKHLLDF